MTYIQECCTISNANKYSAPRLSEHICTQSLEWCSRSEILSYITINKLIIEISRISI